MWERDDNSIAGEYRKPQDHLTTYLEEISNRTETKLKNVIPVRLCHSGGPFVPATMVLSHTLNIMPGQTGICWVSITIDETGDSALTDDVGRFEIAPLASGTYTLLVTADGFQPQTIPGHKVLVGTISTLNISLSPSAITA